MRAAAAGKVSAELWRARPHTYTHAMALPWSLLLELLLYGSCFICGIITAASVTISQVYLLFNISYRRLLQTLP